MIVRRSAGPGFRGTASGFPIRLPGEIGIPAPLPRASSRPNHGEQPVPNVRPDYHRQEICYRCFCVITSTAMSRRSSICMHWLSVRRVPLSLLSA